MNKVLLNLGCGHKLYPAKDGWINVDVLKPDEEHDMHNFLEIEEIAQNTEYDKEADGFFHQSLLQKLQFIDDEVADEIHAYHVAEHFYIDELQDMFVEWKRVLKPNGKLILEMPDIVKCAANFLSGHHNNDPYLKFHLGILGIFGLGSSEKPYMLHKCGLEFGTTKEILKRAGYRNIEEKTAQTHKKHLRDFRVEAIK